MRLVYHIFADCQVKNISAVPHTLPGGISDERMDKRMFDLRLKVKLLLVLTLTVATLGVNLSGGVASAACGECQQVFDETGKVGVGWGCVTSRGSSCTATSDGCTQCTSCACGGNGGGGGGDGREPILP